MGAGLYKEAQRDRSTTQQLAYQRASHVQDAVGLKTGAERAAAADAAIAGHTSPLLARAQETLLTLTARARTLTRDIVLLFNM